MKTLGNSSHITNSGKLIVKSDKTPSLGAFVCTTNKTKIGRVSDIFGPVKTPYVSIKLFQSVNIKNLENILGEKVYILPKKHKRGNKSRVKRKKRLKNKNQKN